ncbi:MAG: thermonuclease family protein [Gallionellaceae bacterium]|jgi:endonuclease YncB( thermonuclease family)
MKRAAALALVWVWASAAPAAEFDAKVIAVMDGDTIMVLHDGAKVKIRMANIDAPEKDQAFGMQSRQSLLDMLQKKLVHINSQAVDQYGRVVGLVSVDGRSVNEEQVRRGMAWEYSHFHSDRSYIALQSEAQQAQRGLWGQSSPLAPWQWRKTHPSVKSDFPQAHNQPAGAHSAPGAVYDTACGHKKHCPQMSSCDEANFYLTHCGAKSLDRNKNGIPCEELCAGNK